MNAEQKQQIEQALRDWETDSSDMFSYEETCEVFAALLQELVDAPEPKSCGWIRAIDEAMVTHHLGVADIADDYEAAKKKLNTLLCLNQDIGEYFSAKAPTPSVPDGDLSEARRIVEQQRGEIERLQQEVTMLRQEYAADTVEIAKLNARLADVEAINSIDARFGGRLALILECVILDPHGHFELACQLLEEYKAEWEKVNPSPPTFMGEPMPPERKLAMNQLLETLK